MTSTIYYFTGSGNSLSNAQKLARELGDAELVSIPRVLKDGEPRMPTSRRIGFVFPTYAYGLPRIVEEFVQKITLPQNAYIFAVASNFGIPGPTLKQLDRLLRKGGRRLHAGFSVLDERSSLIEDPDKDAIQKLMISVNRGEFPEESHERLGEIGEVIRSEEEHALEGSNYLTNLLGGILHRLAGASFKKMGKDYWAGDSCIACGVCCRLCPRGNIRFQGGRPVWGDDCEMCHACIQWCPQEAIEFKELTKGRQRYRNPEVRVEQMLLR